VTTTTSSDLDDVRGKLTELAASGRVDELIELVITLLGSAQSSNTALTSRLQNALRALYGRKSETGSFATSASRRSASRRSREHVSRSSSFASTTTRNVLTALSTTELRVPSRRSHDARRRLRRGLPPPSRRGPSSRGMLAIKVGESLTQSWVSGHRASKRVTSSTTTSATSIHKVRRDARGGKRGGGYRRYARIRRADPSTFTRSSGSS
jgi:hypothetical protein